MNSADPAAATFIPPTYLHLQSDRSAANLPSQMLGTRIRNPAQRLRFAVAAMPRHTREAMLRGIEDNPIAVGAYSDAGSGGICPMLAAHRNGGRTDLSSFARSWDRFTGAKRPRLATEREIRALRSYLEMSLVADETGEEPLTVVAQRIRAERETAAARPPEPRRRIRRDTGERNRGPELRRRHRWSWILPTRRYDVFRDRVAAASGEHSEQRAAELLGSREHERVPVNQG